MTDLISSARGISRLFDIAPYIPIAFEHSRQVAVFLFFLRVTTAISVFTAIMMCTTALPLHLWFGDSARQTLDAASARAARKALKKLRNSPSYVAPVNTTFEFSIPLSADIVASPELSLEFLQPAIKLYERTTVAAVVHSPPALAFHVFLAAMHLAAVLIVVVITRSSVRRLLRATSPPPAVAVTQRRTVRLEGLPDIVPRDAIDIITRAAYESVGAVYPPHTESGTTAATTSAATTTTAAGASPSSTPPASGAAPAAGAASGTTPSRSTRKTTLPRVRSVHDVADGALPVALMPITSPFATRGPTATTARTAAADVAATAAALAAEAGEPTPPPVVLFAANVHKGAALARAYSRAVGRLAACIRSGQAVPPEAYAAMSPMLREVVEAAGCGGDDSCDCRGIAPSLMICAPCGPDVEVAAGSAIMSLQALDRWNADAADAAVGRVRHGMEVRGPFAHVVFADEASAEAFADKYQEGIAIGKWFRTGHKVVDGLPLETRARVVWPAPPPSDLKWEYVGVPRTVRGAWTVMALALLGVIFLCLSTPSAIVAVAQDALISFPPIADRSVIL